MPAVQVAIAEAVRDRIAAAVAAETISQKFTPERSYADWEIDLSKIDNLELRDAEKLFVDVASHTTQQATELSSRTTLQYTVPIDIAIRRKFGPDKQNDDTGRIDIAEVDALILLLQELHVMFTPQRLTDFNTGVWQSTEILAAPVKDHLRKMKQFTGLIRVTFRVDVKLI